jgi:N-acetylglucosaminyldiphosphoundecaprenol N-acetyl-beta-D-mannosaminyltransferase
MAHLRANIHGVPVSALTMRQALNEINEWIARAQRTYVCALAVHGLTEAQTASDMREIYRSAGMVVPDGMPLVWLLHSKGHRAAERVCGPDLMPALLDDSQQYGHRHFFYGSTEATLSLLQQEVNRRFPRAVIAGSHSPPFRPLSEEEEREADRLVNQANPDIVWVGLGAPKQERWMADHRPFLTAPVLIGVGAAFDMVAGKVKRPPHFIRRAGCEWLYRLAQEPKRLTGRYLEINSKFVRMLVEEKLRLLMQHTHT